MLFLIWFTWRDDMTNENMKDNTIYIGKKNTKNYVLAAITVLNQPNTPKLVVKARGKAISTAVDVVEMVRNKFFKNMKIGEIKISTEELSNEDGSTVRVSAIEITLEK